MKYLSLILLAIIGLQGCHVASPESPNVSQTGTNWGVNLITVDSCQYVLFIHPSHGSCAITHHGNCHNVKHHTK